MEARINYRKTDPAGFKAMMGLQTYVNGSTIDRGLRELVFLRASQINGCAYCVDMHTKDARADGESEQRLYLVSAWREAPFYTDRERAALEWTEAVTRVADGHVPDGVYEAARVHFSDQELVDLTLAAVVINGWNRLNVAFRTPAGNYQPASEPARKRA